MMAKNKLLLGNGQALVGAIDWPNGFGTKADIYNIREARAHLHPQLELFSSEAARIPEAAAPRGEIVAKVLVHPEYLAKSHFPTRVLRSSGLRIIGTRSREITPRQRSKKRDSDKPMFTAELLVAGNLAHFSSLDNTLLYSGQIGVQRDFTRIENIALMVPEDRIRRIAPLSDGTVLLEAVLHADANDDDIVTEFSMWAEQCDGKANIKKGITVDGLTFIPVLIGAEQVERLAMFSHVRVLRSAVSLRSSDCAARGITSSTLLLPPESRPIADDIRVAVFDGGLDAPKISDYAAEHVWKETENSDDNFINHGAMVTSAVLFGAISSPTEALPQPFAHVDHYRIATPHDEKDPEMFNAVRRICNVLDQGLHTFANISLAPSMPVDDDDVHLWTSVLEKRLTSGHTLMTVAVGNDGHLAFPESRIQVPADMVNAVAVGACESGNGALSRWEGSCIGPGRSPGLVKPDGVAWGKKVPIFNPRDGSLFHVDGTSVAAPLALRTALGAAALAEGITPAMARALLVHTTERPKNAVIEHTGHGRFSLDPYNLITCGDREAMVTYEGLLEPSRPIGARLPWPSGGVLGMVKIRATLLFYTPVDLSHPINYTRAGIEGRLRRSPGGNTVTFFSKSKLFGNSEQQMRADAHKWETVVSKEIGAQASTLDDPMLELVYRAREEGMAVSNSTLEPLPYVLVITVSANAEPDYYDRVRQRYPILAPVQLRAGFELSA